MNPSLAQLAQQRALEDVAEADGFARTLHVLIRKKWIEFRLLDGLGCWTDYGDRQSACHGECVIEYIDDDEWEGWDPEGPDLEPLEAKCAGCGCILTTEERGPGWRGDLPPADLFCVRCQGE